MRTTFLTTLLSVTLLASAASAAPLPETSSGFFFKPYIGADYQYSSVDYNNIAGSSISYGSFFADSLNGGDVHVGARIHKYLGFEASYFDTASENKSGILGTTASSSVRLDGWTIDAMGYLPLGESQKFELIATAGIARTSASGSVTVSGTPYSEDGSETKARFGGGAQYWLTDNINVRGLVQYQDADFSGVANDMIVTSLGLNWQF